MYPHERSLVERHRDEPFALIGINSDKDLEEIRRIVCEKDLSWRSFWDGPEGMRGPIARSWDVKLWPTVYVLDVEHRIRFHGLRGEDLEAAVRTLLDEARDSRA